MTEAADRVALVLGRAIIRVQALEAELELRDAKIRELEEAAPVREEADDT